MHPNRSTITATVRFLLTTAFVLFPFAMATAQDATSVPDAASPSAPTNIRIIAPYFGPVRSTVEAETSGREIELQDTDSMYGLYAQWIRPGRFQANVFGYHAPDVNYSKLWGLHSNVDLYFDVGPVHNLVLGGGLELISLDIDAGDNISFSTSMGEFTLQDFELEQRIIVPFVRAGKQWHLGSGPVQATVFPWAGAELLMQRGNVSFELPPMGPPGTPTLVDEDIDSTDPKALTGINLRLTLFRFIQLDGKYNIAFDDSDWHPRASLMANLFFTRNLGVSYRWSYTETGAGNTLYNIFGVVVTW